jgi:hypothetical protein
MIIDILLILFIIAGFWLGYAKGLASTLFAISGYILALLLTLKISPWVMGLMVKFLGAGQMFALVFGTLFCLFGFILLINWLVKSVENHLKQSSYSRAGKIGGGIVMTLAGTVVFSYVLWFIVQFGWVGDKTKSSSHSYSVIHKIPVHTGAFAQEFKPLFNRYWELTQSTIAAGKAEPAAE